MFAAMISVAYYLEQVSSQRAEELDALPYDNEAKEAEDKAEAINKIYSEVTQWQVLPQWAKGTLLLSLAALSRAQSSAAAPAGARMLIFPDIR